MKTEISVVIAVRDNWRQLRKCLGSLAAQASPPAFEIIVVDDGSRMPAPPDISSPNVPPVRIARQIGMGISAARNRGVALTSGEIILFVDSDCLLDVNCLRNLARAARIHESDIAFQLALSSPTGSFVGKCEDLKLQAIQETLFENSAHIGYANTSGFAVRAFYAKQNQPLFDVSVMRSEDTMLLARLLGDGRTIRFLPKCKVRHCPVMPFHRYAVKHYWIGYHSRHARMQLQDLPNALMDWKGRGKTMARIWSASRQYKNRALPVAGLILCYAIERLGRAASCWLAPRPGKKTVLSLRMDVVRQSELVYDIVTAAEQRRGLWISYATAWTLVQAQSSKPLRNLLNSADLCYADGFGVGLASVLLRLGRLPKVTAEDFVLKICEELARRKMTLALIGGRSDVITKSGEILVDAAPGLEIVLQSPGYFTDSAEQAMRSELIRLRPNLVLLGMGQPRQEQFVARIRPEMPETVFWCVGGLFDYLTGPRRSIDLSRRIGFEWAYRFLLSPGAMWWRYIVGIPLLAFYVMAQNAADVGRTFQGLARRVRLPQSPDFDDSTTAPASPAADDTPVRRS